MKQKKKKKMPVVFKILIAVLLLVVIVLGAGYAYAQHTLGKINKTTTEDNKKIDPSEETFETDEDKADESSDSDLQKILPEDVIWPDLTKDIMKDRDVVNIMLIGQDRREGQGRQRSDSMMMVTINKKKSAIQVTSFMRDLYVQIPGYSDNRMNAAYQFGGMDLLDQVVEKNFGVHIDGNIEVDFEGFQSCIDLLGGIDLELSQREADYVIGNSQTVLDPQAKDEDWDLKEGMNHLNGEQALIHARNRSVGNSDYERTNRQREVLTAAFEKAKKSDLNTILKLIDKGFPLLTTDLSHGDLMGYAMTVFTMGAGNVESYRIPQDGSFRPAVIRKMDVLVPDLTQCRSYLQENLYQ